MIDDLIPFGFSCGAVLIRSGDTKLIHTSHHRTDVIQDSLVEDEVKITNDTFSRSTYSPEDEASSGSSSWLDSVTQAGSPYRTPLIIIGIITSAVALAAAVLAGMILKETSEAGGVNNNNHNTNNASANNSNKVDGNMGGIEMDPLYPALHSPAAAEQEEEEVPRVEEEDEETERWRILKKAPHLRSPMERVAADDWARQQILSKYKSKYNIGKPFLHLKSFFPKELQQTMFVFVSSLELL